MFERTLESPPHFRSPLSAREIAAGDTLEIHPLVIEVSEQDHGPSGTSLGLLVNGIFAYSTDVGLYRGRTGTVAKYPSLDRGLPPIDPARS